MSRLVEPQPVKRVSEEDFSYGLRYVHKELPDGSLGWTQVPLTAEDALHPQEGDHVSERRVQARDRIHCTQVFTCRFAGVSSAMVLTDCLVDWQVGELRPHSPDISVFVDVRDAEYNWSKFPVVDQGARVLLVVEFVSVRDRDPHSRDNDVVIKREEYHRAGVPLYLIVDQEREDGPRRLVLLRHTPDGYVEEPTDDQGRAFLEPVNLYVVLQDDRVVCYDADTGEEFVEYPAQIAAREVAEAQARTEAEARRVAEERVRGEADARMAAEERVRGEADARKVAEELARTEAEARELAEQRLQALEEELKRLRDRDSGSADDASAT